jgi:hypothetical protein
MILLWLAAAAAPPPSATPRAFINRLYAGFAKPDFTPFKHPERTFAPRLQAAIEEDSRLANGEVGYLDGDPVCQCQDAAGLRATILRVQTKARDKAMVRVSIRLQDYPTRLATFTLVRTKAGWRIADISSADEPSLLRGLEAANRKARAEKP